MAGYGQFCPVAKATELIGEKWTLLVLRELLLDTTRFNDFQRAMSRMSPTLLAKRLRHLEESGVVIRKKLSGRRGYEYRLTAVGKELAPLIEVLAVWGMRWARGQLTDDELDVEFLMRERQRRLQTDHLPDGETVILICERRCETDRSRRTVAAQAMTLSKLPWARIIGEGALIIVSVYFAIVLEGMSQKREAELAAHIALAQMLGEMREDSADVDDIRAMQFVRDRQYMDLHQWLKSPESIPLDLMAESVDSIFLSNRTLYPRRSAWTTMVAAGQLGELDAPDLVARLGNFYESVTVRVIDGGEDYDENLNDIGRNSATQIWDGGNGRLLTTDVRQLTVFQNQLRYMHIGWNLWYLDLLDNYQQTLSSLVLEIEFYLEANGFETGA